MTEASSKCPAKKSGKSSGSTENFVGKVVPKSKTPSQVKRNRPSESLAVALTSYMEEKKKEHEEFMTTFKEMHEQKTKMFTSSLGMFEKTS